jgi:hypothetical protein
MQKKMLWFMLNCLRWTYFMVIYSTFNVFLNCWRWISPRWVVAVIYSTVNSLLWIIPVVNCSIFELFAVNWLRWIVCSELFAVNYRTITQSNFQCGEFAVRRIVLKKAVNCEWWTCYTMNCQLSWTISLTNLTVWGKFIRSLLATDFHL